MSAETALAINTVGFVGLGNQGAPIARRMAGGYPLRVWGRRAATTDPFRDIVQGVDATPAELGARCQMVGVCVVGDDDVREVLLGPNGLLAGMRPGSIVAIHSTVAPATVRELGERAAASGVDLLDAPVSGGSRGAAAGTITILVGGDEAVFQRALPVFQTFGGLIPLLGPWGAGQAMKLLNNGLCFANMAAAVDMFELADVLGIPRETAAEVIGVSTGRSWSFDFIKGYGLGHVPPPPSRGLDKDLNHLIALTNERGMKSSPLIEKAQTLGDRLRAEEAKKR